MPILLKNFFIELSSIIPEIFICFSSLFFLIVGVIKGNQFTKTLIYLSCAVLGAAIIIILTFDSHLTSAFNGFLVHNSFTKFCKILILSSSAVILLLNVKIPEKEINLCFEFPVLILFAVLGMILMVSANDLIMAYMALELQSLAFYILIALKKDSRRALEASLKYFILGTLASIIILYGSSFIYGLTGTTEFLSLSIALKQESLTYSPILGISMLCIVSGFAFKLALAPFHMWSPDVYEGSELSTTVFIASAPKIAIFALFMRFFITVSGSLENWPELLIILAFSSIAIGTLGALYQTHFKRLLGYSAISHMGYAVLGILNFTHIGIQSILLYLTLYVIMIIGLFSCLFNLRKNHQIVDKLSELKGLSEVHPLLAVVITIFLLSLAGIPPLAGFFSKLFIFDAVIAAHFFKVAIFGIVMSIISVAYSLKIIKIIYFEGKESEEELHLFDNISFSPSLIIVSFTALITLSYILYPSLLTPALENAALSLIPSPSFQRFGGQ